MTQRPIKIPQPKALEGDRVRVQNYRRNGRGKNYRPGSGEWELGTVVRVQYNVTSRKKGYWHYDVVLERETPGGKIRLYVGDGGISL